MCFKKYLSECSIRVTKQIGWTFCEIVDAKISACELFSQEKKKKQNKQNKTKKKHGKPNKRYLGPENFAAFQNILMGW